MNTVEPGHRARLVSVADSFDAMTTDRPYRPGMSLEQAAAELRAHAGRQFDAEVVDASLQVLAETGAVGEAETA